MKRITALILCLVLVLGNAYSESYLWGVQGLWVGYAARSNGKQVPIEAVDEDLVISILGNRVILLSKSMSLDRVVLQFDNINNGLEYKETYGDGRWTAMRIENEDQDLVCNVSTSSGASVDYILKHETIYAIDEIYEEYGIENVFKQDGSEEPQNSVAENEDKEYNEMQAELNTPHEGTDGR